MPLPTGLSVQLYTVRNALAEDYDGTLAKIAGFGYTQVEPFSFTNFADELRAGLSKHNLAAPSTHVGLLSGDQEEIFGAGEGARHDAGDRSAQRPRALAVRR